MPPAKAAAPVTGMVRRGHEIEQVGAALASIGTPPNGEIQLIVTPIARSAGRFMARLGDGRVVVTSSLTPFFAAARALLAAGVHPGRMLVMRHSTADSDSLRATISAAARLTVDENNGTLFAPWKPFLRSAVWPAIGTKGSVRTDTAGTAIKPMGEAMAETSAMVATSAPVEPMGRAAIKATTIAMSDTAETMIGSATIPASLREVEPKVVVAFPKQDAEGGGHDQ